MKTKHKKYFKTRKFDYSRYSKRKKYGGKLPIFQTTKTFMRNIYTYIKNIIKLKKLLKNAEERIQLLNDKLKENAQDAVFFVNAVSQFPDNDKIDAEQKIYITQKEQNVLSKIIELETEKKKLNEMIVKHKKLYENLYMQLMKELKNEQFNDKYNLEELENLLKSDKLIT